MTAKQRADWAIETVEAYARNEIWPRVEVYHVATEVERLKREGPEAESAIRAAFERVEQLEREHARRALLRCMERLSQDYWGGAGWYTRLTEWLQECLAGQGDYCPTEEELDELRQLQEAASGWWWWDEKEDRIFRRCT